MEEIKKYTYEEAKNASIEYFNGDELAASVFVDKYALRDGEENILEDTPEKMHRRLAKEFARIEKHKFKEPMTEDEIFGYFKDFTIVPQGSPMSAIGNKYQLQSSGNCWVLPSPLDSYGGILYTDQQLVQLMKRRGGVGICIDNIRPKGMPTRNAAKTTDGIAVFMERYSNTCREVATFGRRGALLIGLSVHHPEIETFINIKRDLKKVNGANVSVKISDEFMKAVKEDREYEQTWPIGSENPVVKKTVNARKIWDLIIDGVWESAEPGVLFWDTIQKRGTSDIYKAKDPLLEDVVTNPCCTGDTLVYVADGRGNVPIKELVEKNEDVPVFCLDDKNHMCVKTMRNPRLTGKNKKILKINIDNGQFVRVTENHKIKLKDGRYVEAKDLKSGDSLYLITKFEASIKDITKDKKSRKGGKYCWVNNGFSSNNAEHRLIASHYYGTIEKGSVVHHIDGDTKNNHPNNLVVLKTEYHDKIHKERMMGDNNPMRRAHSEWSEAKWSEYRSKMSNSLSGDKNPRYMDITHEELLEKAKELCLHIGRRFSSDEWMEFAKKENLPCAFSKYREDEFGTVRDFSIKAATLCGLGENAKEDPRVIDTFNKMKNMGYEPKIENGIVLVNKKCEECGDQFFVDHLRRETSFCSRKCVSSNVNKNEEYRSALSKRVNEYNAQKSIPKKEKQIELYFEIKNKLNREPLRKEWEKYCKENNTPFKFGSKYSFKGYRDLVENAQMYNHKVVSVEEFGYEDVYNGTVDDYHNFFIGGFNEKSKDGSDKYCYINNRNCGEIPMGPDSCRLLLVNIYRFVKNIFLKNAFFDYDYLYKISMIAQRLSDDMVDLELEMMDAIIKKIKSDPEPDNIKQVELDTWKMFKETCKKGRRTGVGITGLGDAIAALNERYGSKESIKIAEKIYETLCMGTLHSSCLMAKELGAFPLYDGELEKNNVFVLQCLNVSKEVKDIHDKHGRRNISWTTTAPAGSVSILTQTTSGIEPVFALAYTRKRKINSEQSENARIDFIDSFGDKWQENTVYHHCFKQWMDISGETEVEKSPYFKATANDIDWLASVEIQAAAQKWVTHSISKTCNLPKSATKELISDIYMKAYDTGCKGFTVYRDGCRDGVLTVKKENEVEEKTDISLLNFLQKNNAPKRPKELPCEVHHPTSQCRKYYVVVGLLSGQPYEVFTGLNHDREGDIVIPKKVTGGKILKKERGIYLLTSFNTEGEEETHHLTNGHTDPNVNALTRMISTSLRHGADISFIVHQLEKTEGDMSCFAKVLARTLKKYASGKKVYGEKCPQCGEENIIRQSGCKQCISCGFSLCM